MGPSEGGQTHSGVILDIETANRALSIAARTIRKVRIRVLPFVFLLFVVAFLDRINIGFAALTMNRELGITSQQYGLIFGVFFFGYSIFEIPSNLLLHKIGARIWIARILITRNAIEQLEEPARRLCQKPDAPSIRSGLDS